MVVMTVIVFPTGAGAGVATLDGEIPHAASSTNSALNSSANGRGAVVFTFSPFSDNETDIIIYKVQQYLPYINEIIYHLLKKASMIFES
jgi:hypothetical protein